MDCCLDLDVDFLNIDLKDLLRDKRLPCDDAEPSVVITDRTKARDTTWT